MEEFELPNHTSDRRGLAERPTPPSRERANSDAPESRTRRIETAQFILVRRPPRKVSKFSLFKLIRIL